MLYQNLKTSSVIMKINISWKIWKFLSESARGHLKYDGSMQAVCMCMTSYCIQSYSQEENSTKVREGISGHNPSFRSLAAVC